MAVRSGAGTGVVVSLVVFVIATISLLVLTIAFYAGRENERQLRAEAESALSRYVRPEQRNQDLFKGLESAAGQQSVAGYLQSRYEALMRYVDGDPGTSLDRLQARMATMGVDRGGVVASAFQDRVRDLRLAEEEIATLNTRLERASRESADIQAQMAQLRESNRQEVQSVQGQIAGYRTAAEEYRTELQNTKRTMNETVDRLHARYESMVAELEQQGDDLHRENTRLRGHVEELQARLSADRIRGTSPELLVDGRIIDATGGSDQVFIDRGRAHRIVLGMTFEVYDDAASIRVDERTGQLPRGKASIQVVRVGDTTSTCKIIRSTPGRPVVRENVIANAVYDPEYQFKFLVHGRFNLSGDGPPTEGDAEFIRSKIIEWGGIVVNADEIPGDLDFLVLGVPPSEPPLLPDNATEFQIRDNLRQRAAKQQYEALLNQARQAQIPVLNHNRFLILIGHTQR